MWGWIRKRSEAKAQLKRDMELSENAPRLHGVNLDDWRYLGRTEVSYVDDRKVATAKATLFAFCGTDDTDDRHFIVMPHQPHVSFDRHTFVMEHAALWVIGERKLWEIVGDEPSQWLHDHMWERFNAVWSDKAKWVVKDAHTPKAETKTAPKNTEMDGNVVKVDFSKEGK